MVQQVSSIHRSNQTRHETESAQRLCINASPRRKTRYRASRLFMYVVLFYTIYWREKRRKEKERRKKKEEKEKDDERTTRTVFVHMLPCEQTGTIFLL